MESAPKNEQTPVDVSNKQLSSGAAPSPPPHPLDREWFLFIDGQTYGPYTGRTIAEYASEARVDRDTQVMRVGTEDWVRASTDLR
ncbi:MAG: DUF4339 domain-containing protein [Beijerinckiaceae bacterium]|nr:DUF4339 domain-containing protein [Beijerinckiaceae bacterium]